MRQNGNPAPSAPKKSWYQSVVDWCTRWHRHRGTLPIGPTDRDTFRLVVLGDSPEEIGGFRVVPSGLLCGPWGEVEVECTQFFREGDQGYISTETLLARARGAKGFRGISTGLMLEGEGARLPHSWRSRRLHFLGHFLLDKDGKRHVLRLEFVKGAWRSDIVAFDDNFWTHNDWFVTQRD